MAFKMKGMDFGSKKVDLTKKPVGPIADPHGVYDDSEHNIHARKTEGTVAEQEVRRNDPPAPGFKSMDASSYIKGQMARKKKKAGAPNYKNPQDYEVFNWGNKATPVRKKKY